MLSIVKTISGNAGDSFPRLTLLLEEIQESLKLIIPLAAIQVSEAAINFIDTLMMGLLGQQNLAAGGLGAIIFSSVFLVCTGLIEGLGALIAEASGQARGHSPYLTKEENRINRLIYQGFGMCLAVSIPAMLLLWYCPAWLPLVGQDASNVALMTVYLRGIVWGMPAVLGFVVLKEVAASMNRPLSLAMIMVIALPLNAFLNYALIYGKAGFPALGLAGIGWSSAFIFWATFFVAVAWMIWHPSFQEARLFRYPYQFEPEILRQIWQLGWPITVQFAAELGMFTVASFLMGYWGTTTLAAHEVVISTVDFVVMVPWGISYAISIRVAQKIGQNNIRGAKRASLIDFSCGIIFTSLLGILFWLFPERIVALFLDFNLPENSETIALAVSLLKIGSIFQIFLGIHFIVQGALRGLQDTEVPMRINLVAYWLVGIGGGCLLNTYFNWQAEGLWLSLTVGMALAVIVLTWRFYQLLRERDKTVKIIKKEQLSSNTVQPLQQAPAST